MEGDKYATQYLYRLRLGDYTNFETAELHADADAAEKEASDMKEISLHENNLDEIDEFNSLWESSKDQLFPTKFPGRSEEHTSELQSRGHLVCRLLLEKKKNRASRKKASY